MRFSVIRQQGFARHRSHIDRENIAEVNEMQIETGRGAECVHAFAERVLVARVEAFDADDGRRRAAFHVMRVGIALGEHGIQQTHCMQIARMYTKENAPLHVKRGRGG